MHRYNRATTKYKDVPNEQKFLIALEDAMRRFIT